MSYSGQYCQSCGEDNVKLVEAAGCKVCAKCAKILKEKGLSQ
jgi:transcription initiation factor TFIIIB Brf1 subunit/transcription initiation factor TFIIB